MRRPDPDDVLEVQARVLPDAPDAPEAVQAAKVPALVVTPHPITLAGQRVLDVRQAALVPGETLADLLARQGVLPAERWAVTVGGLAVPPAMWHRLRPKPGMLIEARRVPGKDYIGMIAAVVISIFAPYAGAAMFGAGTTAAAVASAVIAVAGSMIVAKLLAPKPQKQLSNANQGLTYSLQGGRNSTRPFEPMGLVLGEPYCVPDLAAQPFVFFEGDDQYLLQVFHAGLNCGHVHSLRLGSTSIDGYSGVTLSYDGFSTGNTGLPAMYGNVDTVAGAVLTAEGGPGAWVMRTTSPNTMQIALDFELIGTATNPKTGLFILLVIELQMDFRPVGSSDWTRFWDGVNENDAVAWGTYGSKPARHTLRRSVPLGQYEVRVRKFNADYPSGFSSVQMVTTWVGLKSYQQDTASYGGQGRVGLQIKASGQLNGSVDTLNWMAVARSIPFWNGAAWTTATNRDNGLSNPGAQILMLARGIYEDGELVAGLGLPDEQIDIESLKGFMVFCAVKGFKFDFFLQETMSIGDLIDTIAAAGMGSKSWHTGKLGVIWFSDDDPIEGVLNMGTIKAKSFSVTYDTLATADELEYQYFDREREHTWQSIRVLAPGVVNPTQTARVQLQGVTTEAHAALLARFAMAQNVYQRKTVACDVDLEHLVFRRGTVMAVSHDLTQWGYSGRLNGFSRDSGGIVTLTLDDLVPAVSPTGATSRYVGLRLPGETGYRVFAVAAFAGETRTLVLAGAWPAGAALPGTADNPAHDTVWIYDFKATPGQKLRVADVSPQGNLDGAKVSLVPESPEFWNYVWNGIYAPPPDNSLLAQDLPKVQALRVVPEQERQGEAWVTLLHVLWEVRGAFAVAQVWVGVDGAELRQAAGDVVVQSYTLQAQRDQTWQIEIRVFDSLGRAGEAGRITYHVAAVQPEDVAGLALTVGDDGIYASWTLPQALAGVDWSTTALRKGDTWEDGVPLFEGKADSWRLGWMPAGTLRVWAQHKNTAGEVSTPVSATLEVLDPATPTVAGVAMGRTVNLAWQDCRTTQPVARYVVKLGDVEATAEEVGRTPATSLQRVEPDSDVLVWYHVQAVDVAGNTSDWGSRSVMLLPYFEQIPELGQYIERVDTLAIQFRDELAALGLNGVLRSEAAVSEARKQTKRQVNILEAKVDNNYALYVEQVELLVTADEAMASQISLLSVGLDEARADILEEKTVRATADTALASSITTVVARVDDIEAAYVNQIEVEATVNSAVAQNNEYLTASVGPIGTLAATVSSQGTTIATLDGNLAAQSLIKTEIVGSTGKRAMAGIRIGVSSSNGGTDVQSEVVVLASSFRVANDLGGTGLFAPFKVEDGVTYIDVARIRDADIGTLKVAGNAIIQPAWAVGYSSVSIGFTVPAGQVWEVMALAFFRQTESQTTTPAVHVRTLTGAPDATVYQEAQWTDVGEGGSNAWRSPSGSMGSVFTCTEGGHGCGATTTDGGHITLLLFIAKKKA